MFFFKRSNQAYKLLKPSIRFCAQCADNMDLLKMETLIKEFTSVTKNFLTPEIALHLITPLSPLWTAHIEHIPFKDPFWAFYWPGGQALARYILDNPDIVQGKRVLDIGSGCGAAAIAAAKSNALSVIANDIDPVAGRAILLNCDLNNVNITVNAEHLIGKSSDIGDCILVGDMFYDEEFADILIEWLKYLQMKGRQIFIGDPGRLAFLKNKDNFQSLDMYPLGHEDFSPGFSNVSVWKMK